ncbi:MAG: hypothetical protein BWK80_09460 [Desulfobacteraceae bacterium IS3]|nr:MAG: hypothetical protein BWK80_09460 [Desulfobacteraceae bacterium IS3]
MLTQMIVRLNYQVSCTTDSSDALLIFKREPSKFNLVITDFSMPNMDGISLSFRFVIMEWESGGRALSKGSSVDMRSGLVKKANRFLMLCNFVEL